MFPQFSLLHFSSIIRIIIILIASLKFKHFHFDDFFDLVGRDYFYLIFMHVDFVVLKLLLIAIFIFNFIQIMPWIVSNNISFVFNFIWNSLKIGIPILNCSNLSSNLRVTSFAVGASSDTLALIRFVVPDKRKL